MTARNKSIRRRHRESLEQLYRPQYGRPQPAVTASGAPTGTTGQPANRAARRLLARQQRR